MRKKGLFIYIEICILPALKGNNSCNMYNIRTKVWNVPRWTIDSSSIYNRHWTDYTRL